MYFGKKQPHSLRTFNMNSIRCTGIEQKEERRGNFELKSISLFLADSHSAPTFFRCFPKLSQ